MDNQILKNKIFTILLISFVISSNCLVKVPFEYYPVYKFTSTTPANIFNTLVQVEPYAIVEICGQKINLILEFDVNDFYISKDPKSYYDAAPEYFSDYKFFNKDSCSSLRTIEPWGIYIGDNFNAAEYDRDTFTIDSSKTSLDFYFSGELDLPSCGGIGLQLAPYLEYYTATPDETRTFLRKLKDKNLINKYIFGMFFDNKGFKKKDTGFLLIGDYPEEAKSDLGYYEKSYFNQDKRYETFLEFKDKLVSFDFAFDDVFAYKGKDKSKKIEDIIFGQAALKVSLSYYLNGIYGSEAMHSYLKTKVFSESGCYEDSSTTYGSYSFFYCRKSSTTLSKIKENFPSINFYSENLKSNFTITADDVIIEEGDYIFCLVMFITYLSSSWTLGLPFLKKYLFIKNMESKKISYYTGGQDEDENGGSSTALIIIIIIAIIVTISVAAFVIFMILNKNKKKTTTTPSNDYKAQETTTGLVNDL